MDVKVTTKVITLNMDYWDCECEKYYIHPNQLEHCSLCGAQRVDQPNSRENEVKEQIQFHKIAIESVMSSISKSLSIMFEGYSWEDMIRDSGLTKEEEEFAENHLTYGVEFYE